PKLCESGLMFLVAAGEQRLRGDRSPYDGERGYLRTLAGLALGAMAGGEYPGQLAGGHHVAGVANRVDQFTAQDLHPTCPGPVADGWGEVSGDRVLRGFDRSRDLPVGRPGTDVRAAVEPEPGSDDLRPLVALAACRVRVEEGREPLHVLPGLVLRTDLAVR